MTIAIETKFSVGDKVWYRDNYSSVYEPLCKCPICNGTGQNLLLPNEECTASFKCKDGTLYYCRLGVMSRHHYKAAPECGSVESVDFSYYVDKESGEVMRKTKYFVIRHHHRLCSIAKDEDEMYATKEECQIECDRYNKLNADSIAINNKYK